VRIGAIARVSVLPEEPNIRRPPLCGSCAGWRDSAVSQFFAAGTVAPAGTAGPSLASGRLEHSQVADSAGVASAVLCTDGFAGVLDHRQAALPRDFKDGIEIRGVPDALCGHTEDRHRVLEPLCACPLG
jgi:hypothetical protein